MLPRKPRLLLAGLVTSVMAFALTSAAVGSAEQPQLRANLPVANLPTSALSEREQIMANNLGAGHGARFGITADSYREARQLAETTLGNLYVIPGARGACLMLGESVACGDPGGPGEPGAEDESISALFGLDSSGRFLVGGGVAVDTVRMVTITQGGAIVASMPVVDGVFTLLERDRASFVPGRGFSISTNSDSTSSESISSEAAVWSGPPTAELALVADHCTRYAPSVTQSNCTQRGNFQGYRDTPSVAKRDQNTIGLAFSRSWELWLEDTNNNFHQYRAGVSKGITTGGWNGYAYAACTNHGALVHGVCYTRWHD